MLSACRRSPSPAGHSSSPGTTKRAAAAVASPLEHLDCDPCCTLGRWLAEGTLDDLGPSAFPAQVLHQLSDSGITAVYGARAHHSSFPIRRDHSISPPLFVPFSAAHHAASPAQS